MDQLQQEIMKTLHGMFNTSDFGVVFLNKDNKVVDANPGFEKVTGIPKRAIVGLTAKQIANKYLSKEAINDITKTVKEKFMGKPVTDYTLKFKDKYLKIVPTSGGIGYEGSLAFVHDVTEKEKVEEELRIRESKIKGITSNFTDILYAAKLDGTIIFGDGGEFYGHPPESVIGHNISEFVHPDDMPAVQESLELTLKQGAAPTIEFRLKTKKGYIWVEESGKALYEDGVVIGFTGIIRDISHRKKCADK